MISVIIPVYNAEPYLQQCLDSICSQTFQNLEILAVDDGSTDASAQILAQYAAADSRVHVITQTNRGISKARNTGIDWAKGEWLVFVDSDDWLEPETLEHAMKAALQDQSEIVMWSYMREYPTGPKPLEVFGSVRQKYRAEPLLMPYRRMVGPVGEELSEPQKLNSCVPVWGKLYKRSIVGAHRMVDVADIGSEDTLFNVEVYSEAETVTYLPDLFYHYRKDNAESFTKQNHEKLLSQFSALYDRLRSLIGEDSTLQEALQNRICLGLIGIGMRFSRQSIGSRKKRYALRALLSESEYRQALSRLKFKYLPIQWRCFFFCAKHRLVLCLYYLLRIMDYLRKRG